MAEHDRQEPGEEPAPEDSGAPEPVTAEDVPREGDDPGTRKKSSAPPPPPRDMGALLEKVEPLVQQNRWNDIVAALGPPDRADELSPALALVYAMALAETAGEGSTTDANLLAIRSVATLLAVPPESRTALMVAKRVLRRNPIAWRSRPAPNAPIRIALVVIALALGIVGGWLVGPGSIRLQEIIETVFP